MQNIRCARIAPNLHAYDINSVSSGHLVRIGPNDLVTDDPEIIRKMSAVRSPYTRSDWYNATAFSHKLNHVFCERDEQRHIDLRNKLIPGVCGIPRAPWTSYLS
jgi:hypothetical protein